MSRVGNYIPSYNLKLHEEIKKISSELQQWYWFRERRRRAKFQRGHNLKVN